MNNGHTQIRHRVRSQPKFSNSTPYWFATRCSILRQVQLQQCIFLSITDTICGWTYDDMYVEYSNCSGRELTSVPNASLPVANSWWFCTSYTTDSLLRCVSCAHQWRENWSETHALSRYYFYITLKRRPWVELGHDIRSRRNPFCVWPVSRTA